MRQKHRNYADAVEILALANLYEIAEPTALEAVRLADGLADPMFMVIARANAGTVYIRARNLPAARKTLDEASRIADGIADQSTREKMQAYSFLKNGYLEREAGDFQKSEAAYAEALRRYESMKMPFNQYEARKGELLTHLALGKNAELDEKIPPTLKLLEDYRAQIGEEQERISFFDTEENVYDIAADYEFGRGNLEKAYDYAEISSSRALLDWLQKGAEISGLSDNAEILSKKNGAPLPLSAIRAQMPDEVQIVQYSVIENKIIVWLVSKKRFAAAAVKIESADLREKVERYSELIQSTSSAAPASAEQEQIERLGRELYDLLITPIRPYLDVSQEVCLIPSKSLFYLPFAALIAPNGAPLLAEFTVSYAPSANIFLLCTENARRKSAVSNENLLSVGNPAFDRRDFAELSPLPDAENEAQEIAGFYAETRLLLSRQATEKAFRQAMKNADIVHFAGHYVPVSDVPLSSFLLLAPNENAPENERDNGVLTNSELIGEKLPRVKLVVLSACQTGVEHFYNGEGLIGLSRTFLAAGAPLVVASQWSVETEATAELMKRFHYFRRREKTSSAAALRRAQLEMRNAPDGRFRHPVFWASFAVFGGYANF